MPEFVASVAELKLVDVQGYSGDPIQPNGEEIEIVSDDESNVPAPTAPLAKAAAKPRAKALTKALAKALTKPPATRRNVVSLI